MPGLSVALIRGGRVTWCRAFGVKNALTGGAVSEDTVFEAASLGKPLFAYAVLKLVDAGRLDLDTPLSEYLPGEYVQGPGRPDLVTARMALTHTTGLPNWRPKGEPLRLHFAPGERFSYSGEGFVYLQKAVERLTGRPLEELMRESVFGPLRMKNSSYVWQDRFEALKATAHDASGNSTPLRRPLEANAASSLHTTAADYASFVAAFLRGEGLKAETLREALRPQTGVDEGCQNCASKKPTGRPSRDITWGLGWGLQQTADGLAFWHWGDMRSEAQCYAVGWPSRGDGVVVLTNSGNGHSIIPFIVEEALGVRSPAYAWLPYEPYDSPAKRLYRDILSRGETAVGEYKARRRGVAPLGEKQVGDVGRWLVGKGRLREAIGLLEAGAEDLPNSWVVHDALGAAYARAGDTGRAVRSYERSIELNPDNAEGVEALKNLRGR